MNSRSSAFLASACLATFACSIALASCGTKPPSIGAVEWRLESRPSAKPDESGGEKTFESLSVFASLKGDEGLDSISELWVLNDEAALGWKLGDSEWTKASENGETWMGASSLATPDLGSLPRGKYRFVAVDMAGQRAEIGFSVEGDFPERDPPRLSYENGRIKLSSDWPETLALGFDAAGVLIASPRASQGTMTLTAAFEADFAPRIASIGAYGYDPNLRMGAFSERMSAR